MNIRTPEEQPILRYGAVAVIVRQQRLLVIRRSQHVIAPGDYCFPGGGIEPGETETQALVRELREELNCDVRPLKRLGETVSHWRVHLAWWHSALADDAQLAPNPLEVAAIHWLTPEEIIALPNLLDSNRDFIGSMLRGELPFAME